MKKYTKWQVLNFYESNIDIFCIQARINKKTGFMHFKVNRVNHKCTSTRIKPDLNINEQFKKILDLDKVLCS